MTRPVALVLIVAVTAACGYALAGRGNTLPQHIRRIGVPLLENRSTVGELDRVVTEAIRQELQTRGRFVIVDASTGVDAVLTGRLEPVGWTVSAFTDTRQASRYLVTIQASVEFKDLRDNKVLWNNAAMRASEEYAAEGSQAVNDPSALFSQDQNALMRLARTFAQRLVAAMLENF